MPTHKSSKRSSHGTVDWKATVSWWRATHNNRLLEIEVYPDGAAWWYVTDAKGTFLTGGTTLTVNQAKRFAQEAASNEGYPNGVKHRKSPRRRS